MPDSARGQFYLTAEEIEAWPAATAPGADHKAPLRRALMRNGVFDRRQTGGRNWAIGCVALEITQRCNLDCTLCYLSYHAEAVHDLPLKEVFRRIDVIHDHYGPGTNVQVTGGDPTLRKRAELVAIIRRISEKRMRPALFTNGIKATRDLLAELAQAGLKDVAFHVDMTQARKGYASEADLNAVRLDYIRRAKGLGLDIIFNTTIFDGNSHEVSGLVRFFIAHASDIHLASFQLQAETGRGVLGGRSAGLSQASVIEAINRGAGVPLSFDMPWTGHPDCNRYTGVLTAGGVVTPLFDDETLFAELFRRTARFRFDRVSWPHRLAQLIAIIAHNPGIWPRVLGYGLKKAWQLRRGLIRSGGRLNKLTLFIHNFMDAQRLERARCESCVFMTASAAGPISMCVYNARRDTEILKPIVDGNSGNWHPLSGKTAPGADPGMPELARKHLKGRLKAADRAKRPA